MTGLWLELKCVPPYERAFWSKIFASVLHSMTSICLKTAVVALEPFGAFRSAMCLVHAMR
jgi:hypothetical protein